MCMMCFNNQRLYYRLKEKFHTSKNRGHYPKCIRTVKNQRPTGLTWQKYTYAKRTIDEILIDKAKTNAVGTRPDCNFWPSEYYFCHKKCIKCFI